MGWQVLAASLSGLLALWLGLLLGYLAMPFDVAPDAAPVIGYADDVVAVVWALRQVCR